MADKNKKTEPDNLPQTTREYIDLVIKKMRYRKSVRREVRAELTAHFEDELADCTDQKQREEKAHQLIGQFGDAKLLGVLLRRAKKRCRPLWQKALIRTFQVILVFAGYFLICLLPLLIGEPEINTDYVQWLTDMVRAGHNKEDNARPLYDRAADYFVKASDSISLMHSYWPGDMNETELSQCRQWLSENQKAMELFRRAAKKPYFWTDYKAEQIRDSNEPLPETYRIITPKPLKGHYFQFIMKDLAEYRRLARMAMAYAFLEAYKGNIGQAFDDAFTLIKFGQSMEGKGLLIEQLVGIAIEALGRGVILKLISEVDVPPEMLESIQQRIEKEIMDNKPVLDFTAEKAFWYDSIQRSFTSEDNGRGRPLLKALPLVATNWYDTLLMFVTFDLPGRKELVGDIERFFEQSELLAETSPARLADDTFLTKEQKEEMPFMLRTLLPAFERTSQLSWRVRMGRRALPAILAALRYQKENGIYPESLEQLFSENYLQQIPTDLYSSKPMIYRKTGGGFVLYSIGPNKKDDGGKITYNKQGGVEQWQEESDFIFWPVQK